MGDDLRQDEPGWEPDDIIKRGVTENTDAEGHALTSDDAARREGDENRDGDEADDKPAQRTQSAGAKST